MPIIIKIESKVVSFFLKLFLNFSKILEEV